ncbi:hypothetical protein A5753_06710 [Mycobacterium sp. 852002-51971_SCH5477799-a]|nr:hypothetical protein A5753_06710 [Mycobacterium sp. 852002-51971_SCH5477799-a]
MYAVLPGSGCVVLMSLAAQWSRSNPWDLHHASGPLESAKVMPATVTQKSAAENVDQSPDQSNFTVG